MNYRCTIVSPCHRSLPSTSFETHALLTSAVCIILPIGFLEQEMPRSAETTKRQTGDEAGWRLSCSKGTSLTHSESDLWFKLAYDGARGTGRVEDSTAVCPCIIYGAGTAKFCQGSARPVCGLAHGAFEEGVTMCCFFHNLNRTRARAQSLSHSHERQSDCHSCNTTPVPTN